MRLDEILVGEVDAWRRHRTCYHLLTVAEKMVIVGVAVGRKGQHQRRSSAAPSAAAALNVIRRCRRDVAEMDGGQVSDVDPELHRRRAEKYRQFALLELLLALDAKLWRNLASVVGRGKPP